MDYDFFFYLYCFQLNRTEDEFYRSTLAKVLKMLDISGDEAAIKAAEINNEQYQPKYFVSRPENEVSTISSMKEVEGFL